MLAFKPDQRGAALADLAQRGFHIGYRVVGAVVAFAVLPGGENCAAVIGGGIQRLGEGLAVALVAGIADAVIRDARGLDRKSVV